MATNLANEEKGSSQVKKNVNDWKYPKIPIDQVYKKKLLDISATYAVKDYEDTITVNGNDNNIFGSLLSSNFLNSFVKKQHRFVHLGLVQIAIKPLVRDGLGSPVVVSLRDARQHNFRNSLLALVKANLSQGAIYFNCFPSFSVASDDAASLFDVLTLDVKTGGVPLALAYRMVCKAMVDLSPEARQELVLGETAYFQPATGTRATTKWDDEYELQVHESSTRNQEIEAKDEDTLPDNHLHKQGKSISTKFSGEQEGSFLNRIKLGEWKYDKIAVDQVYNISLWTKAKRLFKVFPITMKDYEKTISLKAPNNQVNKSFDLIKEIFKGREDGYVHLGLVQMAIKPLLNDGVGAPVIVCLRDTRLKKFEDSLFALVQANLSQGPFYFNCSPGFSIPFGENFSVLNLHVSSGVPLVLTYRLVCNVTSGVTWCFTKSLVRGETAYYQPSSKCKRTTKWDEVQIPESWIQREPNQTTSKSRYQNMRTLVAAMNIRPVPKHLPTPLRQ